MALPADCKVVDIDLQLLKIDVLPLETGQFSAPQPGRHVQKQQDTLPQLQFGDDSLHLGDFENVGNALPLGTLANAGTFHWSRDGVSNMAPLLDLVSTVTIVV